MGAEKVIDPPDLFFGMGKNVFTRLGNRARERSYNTSRTAGHGARSPSLQEGAHQDRLGLRGLERLGPRKWQQHPLTCVNRLAAALRVDEVVIEGGNVHTLKELPTRRREAHNSNASRGGFFMWNDTQIRKRKSVR